MKKEALKWLRKQKNMNIQLLRTLKNECEKHADKAREELKQQIKLLNYAIKCVEEAKEK